MRTLAIYADRVLTPLEEIREAVVLVEEGRITAVGRRSEVTLPAGAKEHFARGMTVVPGFVDVHIHGAGGHDVMEGGTEALDVVASTVARHGTTSLLATTVSADETCTCKSVQGIARYIRAQSARAPAAAPRAEILGIHFEGPFISHARRGVHPAECVVAPSTQMLRRFLDAADGTGRILTLAPELPGALEVMEAAHRAGLLVAMGHTNATYAETCAAIDKGVRHAVHVFNAMRPFSHRETGVLGAVLTSPGVSAELIADGVHVDPPAMRLLLAAKGVAHILLVSDATAATDMPDGKYQLGGLELSVSGGVCRNAEGKLAGSTLTLDRALHNVVELGVSLADAIRMLTLNPAQLLGVADRKGALVPGADADLIFLDAELQVAGVMTRGVGLN